LNSKIGVSFTNYDFVNTSMLRRYCNGDENFTTETINEAIIKSVRDMLKSRV